MRFCKTLFYRHIFFVSLILSLVFTVASCSQSTTKSKYSKSAKPCKCDKRKRTIFETKSVAEKTIIYLNN